VLHTDATGSSRRRNSELDHHGLLSSEQVHVHCNTLDDGNLRRLAEHDCKISSSPETELQMEWVTRDQQGAEAGHAPSLSCDSSPATGDMFSQMRIVSPLSGVSHNDSYNLRNQMPTAWS